MGADIFTIINISVEVFCCLIFIIIIASILLNGQIHTRKEKIFFWVLIAAFIQVLTDLFAWAFDTYPGDTARAVCVMSNFLTFSFLGIGMLIYAFYVWSCLSLKTRFAKLIFLFIIALSTIYEIVIIISQFNGIIYKIDAENVYTNGPYYPYVSINACIIFLLEFLLVMGDRKRLGFKNTLIIASYAYVPLVFSVGLFLFPDIMFANIGFSLALISVYTSYQSQESQRIKQENIRAETAIMLSQIQPHFLYNTLGAICELCDGNEGAQKALITFSNYLRTNMNTLSQKGLIPFKKELEHVRQYLWLEKMRFEDKLNVVYDIKTDNFLLPALTVQPIVENAILHGIMKGENGGRICISTEEEDGFFYVFVEDDGDGFLPEKDIEGDHIGLVNVQARLKAMCAGELIIKSTALRGTQVSIKIPGEKAV